MAESIYVQKGYKSRIHYLTCLADDYAVDSFYVMSIADLLGPEEDFDGLVSMVQDLPEID